MSSAVSNTDELVEALLAAAQKDAPAEQEQAEARDYDFYVPCRFTPLQLGKLREVVAGLAGRISELLGSRLGEPTALEPEEPAQKYAGRFSLSDDQGAHYCIALEAREGEPCGLIAVSEASAGRWVTKALGGAAEGAEASQGLSSLESALLQEIVAEVIGLFSDELERAGGKSLRCGPAVAKSPELHASDDSDEYCVLGFRADEGQPPAISLVVQSEALLPVVDAGAAAAAPTKSPKELRAQMRTYVESAPMRAEACLGTVELAIRDVADLAVGDIVVLDRKIDEPAELTVAGRTVLTGYPARSDEQYALQVIAHADAPVE